MTFTVVIPLFNKEAFIRDTVASALSQTCPDFEIVVVDDGSTDASLAEVASFADPRIRVVTQVNAGPGAARNRGFATARHEWVALLDADDLWLPHHLSTLAGVIEAHPEASVVSTSYLTARHGDEMKAAPKAGRTRAIEYFTRSTSEPNFHTSCIAIRRSAFQQTSGFGPYCPGEDTEFWSRLALDHAFAVSSVTTSAYVRSTGGLMDSVVYSRSDQVPRLPVLETLDAALADPKRKPRHASIRLYREKLLMQYIRASIYQGNQNIARCLLRRRSVTFRPTTLLYIVLSILPGSVTATFSYAYTRAKNMVRA